MTHTVATLVLALQDFGQGQAPPGSDKINKLFFWATWVCCAIGVFGIIAVGATMAIKHRRGEHSEHLGSLAVVLAGIFLIGGATGLANAVI